MAATAEGKSFVEATEEEIDALVAEFGGDPREAIRAFLHGLTELAIDPKQRCRAALSAVSFFHSDCGKRRRRSHEQEDDPRQLAGGSPRAARGSRNMPRRSHPRDDTNETGWPALLFRLDRSGSDRRARPDADWRAGTIFRSGRTASAERRRNSQNKKPQPASCKRSGAADFDGRRPGHA